MDTNINKELVGYKMMFHSGIGTVMVSSISIHVRIQMSTYKHGEYMYMSQVILYFPQSMCALPSKEAVHVTMYYVPFIRAYVL
jgi:hypothetical protein